MMPVTATCSLCSTLEDDLGYHLLREHSHDEIARELVRAWAERDDLRRRDDLADEEVAVIAGRVRDRAELAAVLEGIPAKLSPIAMRIEGTPEAGVFADFVRGLIDQLRGLALSSYLIEDPAAHGLLAAFEKTGRKARTATLARAAGWSPARMRKSLVRASQRGIVTRSSKLWNLLVDPPVTS